MKPRSKALVLVLVCTVFTSLGQLFFKLASRGISPNIVSIVTNRYLITGLALYFIGAMILVAALKFGELSRVYPLISLSFVWVFVIGVLLFNELVTPLKAVGTATIMGGVSLLALQ